MAIPKIHAYDIQDLLTVENKVTWPIFTQRAALLVHDMQNYFLNFYDQTQAPIPTLIENTQRMIKWAHENNVPVYYTAQPGDQDPQERALLTDFWGAGLKADAELTGIHSAVAPSAQDCVLTKWRYSAFVKSDFKQRLQAQHRDQLIVVGVYAHIGCMQTIMEAFMNDIQGFLVRDAVADFSLEEHNLALKYVAGRGGRVVSTKEVVTIQNKVSANLESVSC